MKRGVRTVVVAVVVTVVLSASLVFGVLAGLHLVSGDWLPQPVVCVDAVNVLVATIYTYPDQAEAAANYLVLNCPDLDDPAGVRDL